VITCRGMSSEGPMTGSSSPAGSPSINPSEPEGSFFGRMVQAALSSAILGMVTKVYVPVLFPLTFLIGLTALWMDKALGFGDGFLPESAKWWVAGGSFLLGTFLWLWTYEQLTREGKGSPSPTAGRTTVLVTTGIYAHSRNPSLFGKLLGVLAVGMVMNSFSFCFILIPALLVGSLVEKVWRQEPQLVEIFGEEYLRYQKDVPLFIPWKLFLPGKRQGST
jgi:protein-S-isoprenylcysteine O-methyltransferase Ste14